MGQTLLDEHVLRKYLLGVLSEEDRERIEERLLTDNGFYENLLPLEDVAEDELIEQYLNDELTGPEQEGFERVFLSTPERREKLQLARDLNSYASFAALKSSAATASEPSWWQQFPSLLRFQNPLLGASLVAALLLVTIACIALLFKVRHLETELSRTMGQPQSPPAQDQRLQEQVDQLRTRNVELAANLEQAEDQRARLDHELTNLREQEGHKLNIARDTVPAPALIPSFSIPLTLVGGRSTEGEGIKAFNLPSNLISVKLTLYLDTIDPKDYQSYRATVEKRGGKEIFKTNKFAIKTAAGEPRLIFTMPAALLSDGEYNVNLNGTASNGQSEPLGIYAFRITVR